MTAECRRCKLWRGVAIRLYMTVRNRQHLWRLCAEARAVPMQANGVAAYLTTLALFFSTWRCGLCWPSSRLSCSLLYL